MKNKARRKVLAKNNARIAKLAEIYKNDLDDLSKQLAMNFEAPANRLINFALAKIGITRVEYEQIKCFQAGVAYEPIPERLLDRWASC